MRTSKEKPYGNNLIGSVGSGRFKLSKDDFYILPRFYGLFDTVRVGNHFFFNDFPRVAEFTVNDAVFDWGRGLSPQEFNLSNFRKHFRQLLSGQVSGADALLQHWSQDFEYVSTHQAAFQNPKYSLTPGKESLKAACYIKDGELFFSFECTSIVIKALDSSHSDEPQQFQFDQQVKHILKYDQQAGLFKLDEIRTTCPLLDDFCLGQAVIDDVYFWKLAAWEERDSPQAAFFERYQAELREACQQEKMLITKSLSEDKTGLYFYTYLTNELHQSWWDNYQNLQGVFASLDNLESMLSHYRYGLPTSSFKDRENALASIVDAVDQISKDISIPSFMSDTVKSVKRALQQEQEFVVKGQVFEMSGRLEQESLKKYKEEKSIYHVTGRWGAEHKSRRAFYRNLKENAKVLDVSLQDISWITKVDSQLEKLQSALLDYIKQLKLTQQNRKYKVENNTQIYLIYTLWSVIKNFRQVGAENKDDYEVLLQLIDRYKAVNQNLVWWRARPLKNIFEKVEFEPVKQKPVSFSSVLAKQLHDKINRFQPRRFRRRMNKLLTPVRGFFGTAFNVDAKLLESAYHQFQNATDLPMLEHLYKAYEARVKGCDLENDVAILYLLFKYQRSYQAMLADDSSALRFSHTASEFFSIINTSDEVRYSHYLQTVKQSFIKDLDFQQKESYRVYKSGFMGAHLDISKESNTIFDIENKIALLASHLSLSLEDKISQLSGYLIGYSQDLMSQIQLSHLNETDKADAIEKATRAIVSGGVFALFTFYQKTFSLNGSHSIDHLFENPQFEGFVNTLKQALMQFGDAGESAFNSLQQQLTADNSSYLYGLALLLRNSLVCREAMHDSIDERELQDLLVRFKEDCEKAERVKTKLLPYKEGTDNVLLDTYKIALGLMKDQVAAAHAERVESLIELPAASLNQEAVVRFGDLLKEPQFILALYQLRCQTNDEARFQGLAKLAREYIGNVIEGTGRRRQRALLYASALPIEDREEILSHVDELSSAGLMETFGLTNADRVYLKSALQQEAFLTRLDEQFTIFSEVLLTAAQIDNAAQNKMPIPAVRAKLIIKPKLQDLEVYTEGSYPAFKEVWEYTERAEQSNSIRTVRKPEDFLPIVEDQPVDLRLTQFFDEKLKPLFSDLDAFIERRKPLVSQLDEAFSQSTALAYQNSLINKTLHAWVSCIVSATKDFEIDEVSQFLQDHLKQYDKQFLEKLIMAGCAKSTLDAFKGLFECAGIDGFQMVANVQSVLKGNVRSLQSAALLSHIRNVDNTFMDMIKVAVRADKTRLEIGQFFINIFRHQLMDTVDEVKGKQPESLALEDNGQEGANTFDGIEDFCDEVQRSPSLREQLSAEESAEAAALAAKQSSPTQKRPLEARGPVLSFFFGARRDRPDTAARAHSPAKEAPSRGAAAAERKVSTEVNMPSPGKVR